MEPLARFIKNPKQYVKDIRPMNYRPAPVPRGIQPTRARDYRAPVVPIPKIASPKQIAEAERGAINKAVKNTGWLSRTHQTINKSLSDPRYNGWSKRACWAPAVLAGGNYFIEVHYNINMSTNVADDYKVKSWSNYKPIGTGALHPC